MVYIIFEIYLNCSTKKALVRLTNADLLCYNSYIRYAGKLGVWLWCNRTLRLVWDWRLIQDLLFFYFQRTFIHIILHLWKLVNTTTYSRNRNNKNCYYCYCCYSCYYWTINSQLAWVFCCYSCNNSIEYSQIPTLPSC